MKKNNFILFINSTVAFIFAFTFVTLFHELGHWTAYRLMNFDAVIYHNRVDAGISSITNIQHIIGLSAGPLAGLLLAIIAFIILKARDKNNAFDLLLLWTYLLALVNFFGYLMLTPLSAAGDTAKIANIINMPDFAKWIIAIIGFVILMFLIVKSGEKFNEFIDVSKVNDFSKFPVYILTYPIILGSIINVLLALPVVVAVSLVYPATSSFAVFAARGKLGNNSSKLHSNSIVYDKINSWLIVALIIIILINRMLVHGYK